MNYKIDKDLELKVVSFEQARALKELGFPQRLKRGTLCQCYYNGHFCEDTDSLKVRCGMTTPQEPWVKDEYYYSAPTLELVAKWLRDKKNINIMISNFDGRMAGFSEVSYMYIMSNIKPIKSLHNCHTMYDTWEQALSAGIDKAIEILTEE